MILNKMIPQRNLITVLSLVCIVSALGQTTRSVDDLPTIAGAGIDKASDFILVRDASITAPSPALRKMTITELVNIPGLFTVTNITGLGSGVAAALAITPGNNGAVVLNGSAATHTNLTVSGVTLYGAGLFVTESTTARTLTSADSGKVILCTNAAAVTITLNTGLPTYFHCTILQKGAGTVTVTGSATRQVASGFSAKSGGQYTGFTLTNDGTLDTYQFGGTLGL